MVVVALGVPLFSGCNGGDCAADGRGSYLGAQEPEAVAVWLASLIGAWTSRIGIELWAGELCLKHDHAITKLPICHRGMTTMLHRALVDEKDPGQDDFALESAC